MIKHLLPRIGGTQVLDDFVDFAVSVTRATEQHVKKAGTVVRTV